MNVKMTIAERATTRLALGLHVKLVESAKKATVKALVEPMTLLAAEVLIDAAFNSLPSSQAVNELWDVTHPIVMEYRDALYLLGSEVSKVRMKEIERGIDTQSSDARLEEIRTLLRGLGDQRDLFAALNDALSDDSENGGEDDDQIGFAEGRESDLDDRSTIAINDGEPIPMKEFKRRVDKLTKRATEAGL